MYRGTRSEQLMLVFGLFGLSALTPSPGLYPSWLIVATVMLPYLLLEGGALLLARPTSNGRGRTGLRLQLAGVWTFVAVFVLLSWIGTTEPSAVWTGRAFVFVGAVEIFRIARACQAALRVWPVAPHARVVER